MPCRGSRTGSSKKALPPIGLWADEHSRLALETQKRPTDFEEVGLVDKNLQFAASELQRHDLRLRELHQHMVKWVLELASRCLAVEEVVLQTVLTDFCVQFASVAHCWLCTVNFT